MPFDRSPAAVAALARHFHTLHAGPGLLRLPNAWDAGSARLVTAQGASAVATSSAAVAWAQGYGDGDKLPVARLLQVVEAITDACDNQPVTIDIESGYSDDPAAVAALAGQLMALGVVGINLEDGNGPADVLAAKIAAVRRVADGAAIDLFINARTDVWLRGTLPADARVDDALARAARYRDAGASGLFVPALVDPDGLARVVDGARLPVNVLAWTGLPDPAALERLGVRRLSAGSGLAEHANGLLAAMTRTFLREGRVDGGGVTPLSWSDLNGVMGR